MLLVCVITYHYQNTHTVSCTSEDQRRHRSDMLIHSSVGRTYLRIMYGEMMLNISDHSLPASPKVAKNTIGEHVPALALICKARIVNSQELCKTFPTPNEGDICICASMLVPPQVAGSRGVGAGLTTHHGRLFGKQNVRSSPTCAEFCVRLQETVNHFLVSAPTHYQPS